MAFVDVFKSDFRLGPKVCIVAPGPNGRGYYAKIPPEFQILVVGKAVLISELRSPEIWMMTHSHQDWFDDANVRFHGVSVFSHDAASRRARQFAGCDECYYFKPQEPGLSADPLPRIDGAIRYGGSVTACALQLAYNFGADEVIVCGADMSGDDYFDGTQNPQATHGDTWPAAHAIARLVRDLERLKGTRVWTLSPTKLPLPRYAPLERA